MKRILFFLLVLGLILDLFWGQVWKNLMDNNISALGDIFLYFRLPRLLNAVISGAGLALTGLVLQTVFQNPLAGPYVLGISSGAAFGVALALLFFSVVSVNLSFAAMYVFAIAGSMVVMAVLSLLARRFSMVTVIISGVILAGFFAALINILQYFSPAYAVKDFVLWTMASVDMADYRIIVLNALVVIMFVLWLSRQGNLLDSLYLGDDYARSIGVDAALFKRKILLFSGLVIAVLTSAYGPIAFAGVISPHVARWLTHSYSHKTLMIHTLLTGIVIMLFADFLSHAFSFSLPLNSVLSLFGLPVMLLLVLRNPRMVA